MFEIEIGGINLEAEVDANFKALHLIPFRFNKVNLTDLGIKLLINIETTDGIHFKVVDSTVVTLGRVDIEMTNEYLNRVAQATTTAINRIAQMLLPQVGLVIDGMVASYN